MLSCPYPNVFTFLIRNYTFLEYLPSRNLLNFQVLSKSTKAIPLAILSSEEGYSLRQLVLRQKRINFILAQNKICSFSSFSSSGGFVGIWRTINNATFELFTLLLCKLAVLQLLLIDFTYATTCFAGALMEKPLYKCG